MKLSKFLTRILSLSATCAIIFIACKKTDDFLTPLPPVLQTPPVANDNIKVITRVSGTVIDENNKPIANAAVTSGMYTSTTDAMGNFVFTNITISALNGSVTVIKAGYFKGIRSFTAEAGKNNYVKIQLIKQVLSGTVATAGGTVTTSGGTIDFPANAFVTGTGAAYTGNAKIFATYIDPTAANLPLVVPGSLRGVDSTNGEYLLKSYGMIGADLQDENGNALKIAPGKTATITFNIPAVLQGQSPSTIPLWHFDEATARWRKEGSAIKSGTSYTARVNKFSFWNVDVPANFVNLEMLLVNSANNLPLANTMVKVTSLNSNTYAYDFTNDSGYVSGFVPKNEYLKIEVLAGTACNANPSVIYSQNAGPYNNNTSLGNISVTVPSNFIINFTGIVNNCSNQPVTNGYISLSLANGASTIAYTNASGAVNFSLVSCGGSNTAFSYTAVDLGGNSYSNVMTGTASAANVNLGNVSACGNVINASGIYIAGSIDDRAMLWKDGNITYLTAPPTGKRTAYAYKVKLYNNDVYVLGGEDDSTAAGWISTIKLWKNGALTNITSDTTQPYATGFDVYNGNVYICSEEGSGSNFKNKIWINGVPSILPNNGLNYAEATGIKVGSNGDVYISGQGRYFNGVYNTFVPFYWKNGVINQLSATSESSSASGVFINGNDVYFSGQDTSNVVYWKNGVETMINVQSPYQSAYSNSIFVNSSDVYIAGYQYYFTGQASAHNATYWKNNTVNILTNYPPTSSSNDVELYEVFVKNNIVYSVGYVYNQGNSNYLYFQNNIAVPLSGIGSSQQVFLGGIFVQ